jgi:hypothetical protein
MTADLGHDSEKPFASPPRSGCGTFSDKLMIVSFWPQKAKSA